MNGFGVVTFVLLSSVLLWFIVVGRGRWLPKFTMTLVVMAFAFVSWKASLSFTGWPTSERLPEIGIFVSGFVVEPSSDREGSIYLWLVSAPYEGKNIYRYRPKRGEPRAYVLPYTRDMHEQVQAALEAQAKGKRVLFATKKPDEAAQPVNRNQPSNNRGPHNSGTRGGAPGFYILPNAPHIDKNSRG